MKTTLLILLLVWVAPILLLAPMVLLHISRQRRGSRELPTADIDRAKAFQKVARVDEQQPGIMPVRDSNAA